MKLAVKSTSADLAESPDVIPCGRQQRRMIAQKLCSGIIWFSYNTSTFCVNNHRGSSQGVLGCTLITIKFIMLRRLDMKAVRQNQVPFGRGNCPGGNGR